MTRCAGAALTTRNAGLFGLLALLTSSACLDDPSASKAGPETVDEFRPGCLDVAAGQPFASPAAFEAIRAAEEAGTVLVDDTMAPRVISPNVRYVSTTVPPSFRFTAPTLAALTDHPAAPPAPPRGSGGVFDRIARALVPTAQAQACPPLTGENFLFRVWDHRAGQTNMHSLDVPLYTALLAEPHIIPEGALWREKMLGRYTELRIEVVRVLFNQGVLIAGPFKSSVRTAFETLPDMSLEAANRQETPPEEVPVDPGTQG